MNQTDDDKKQTLRVEYAIHKKKAKAFFKFLHAPEPQPEFRAFMFGLEGGGDKNLRSITVWPMLKGEKNCN